MPSLVEKQLIYLEKSCKKWTLNLLLHMLVLSRDLDISLTLLLQRNQSDESPSAMDTECTLDKRPEDLEEEKSVSDLKKATCGCSCSSGGPCSNLFSANYLMDYRNSCSEMTSTELDLAILSAMACARARLTTRTKITYIHQGKHICMKVFLYLHGIS